MDVKYKIVLSKSILKTYGDMYKGIVPKYTKVIYWSCLSPYIMVCLKDSHQESSKLVSQGQERQDLVF